MKFSLFPRARGHFLCLPRVISSLCRKLHFDLHSALLFEAVECFNLFSAPLLAVNINLICSQLWRRLKTKNSEESFYQPCEILPHHKPFLAAGLYSELCPSLESKGSCWVAHPGKALSQCMDGPHSLVSVKLLLQDMDELYGLTWNLEFSSPSYCHLAFAVPLGRREKRITRQDGFVRHFDCSATQLFSRYISTLVVIDRGKENKVQPVV